MGKLTDNIISIFNRQPRLYAGISILSFGAALLLLVAGNWTSFFTTYFNDVFFVLDGAFRLKSGQIPHLDFHTSLGALTYVLPYLTLVFSDSFGAVVPVMHIAAYIFFAPVMLYVLLSRFRPLMAFLAATYLLALLLVPMPVGALNREFSLAMYYNRFCWVALALLFMLYITPYGRARHMKYADSAVMALLLLFMFYIKVTYALVGVAFVAYLYLDNADYRGRISVAAIVAACVVAVLEASYHFHGAYLANIYDTIQVSSAMRGGIKSQVIIAINNSSQVMYLVFAAFLLRVMVRPGYRVYLYFLVTLAACVVINNQNADRFSLVALIAPLMVASEMLMRNRDKSDGPVVAGAAAHMHMITGFILLFFVFQPVMTRSVNLAYYAYMNITQKDYLSGYPMLRGLRFYEESNWRSRRAWIYVEQLRDGAGWFAKADIKGSVLALNFSNPFSFTFNQSPPTGGYAWFHYLRNISESYFIPPEELFRDVDIVMVPAIVERTEMVDLVKPLKEIYGPYIEDNYTEIEATPYWTIYRLTDS